MNLTLVESWNPQATTIALEQIGSKSIAVGDEIHVGEVNGLWGKVKVVHVVSDSVIVQGELLNRPPPEIATTVCVATTRPKMFRRTFESLVEIGCKDIVVFRSFNCDKNYEKSEIYSETHLKALAMNGLRQCCDTAMPKIRTIHAFKVLIEDVLLTQFSAKNIVVADPKAEKSFQSRLKVDALLIGPEAGFSRREIELCEKYQLPILNFGLRQLRFETAVPFILGQLQQF